MDIQKFKNWCSEKRQDYSEQADIWRNQIKKFETEIGYEDNIIFENLCDLTQAKMAVDIFGRYQNCSEEHTKESLYLVIAREALEPVGDTWSGRKNDMARIRHEAKQEALKIIINYLMFN